MSIRADGVASSQAVRAIVPGRCKHRLPLLTGKRLGDHACPPDALHEAGSPAALDLQDNWIIRIAALSDNLDRPGCEVEGVVMLRGLQPLN